MQDSACEEFDSLGVDGIYATVIAYFLSGFLREGADMAVDIACEEAEDAARTIVGRMEAIAADVTGLVFGDAEPESGLQMGEVAALMEQEISEKRDVFDQALVEEAVRLVEEAEEVEEVEQAEGATEETEETQRYSAAPAPWPSPTAGPSNRPTPRPTARPTAAPTPCDPAKAPEAPKLASARVSDNGAGVIFAFDVPTDRFGKGGSNFDCADLVTMDGLADYCAFREATLLEAVLGASSQIEPGSTATLLAGKLRTEGAEHCFPASDQASSAVVEGPANPVAPTVVFDAPKTVGTCDELVVDASSTQGSGGRPWKSVTWEATAEGAGA